VKLHNFEDLAREAMADPVRRANIERHRQEAIAEIVEYTLGELRKHQHMTQAELAEALGISQPTISSVEHAGNVELSTLRSYIQALGGTMEVAAVFGDERFPLALD